MSVSDILSLLAILFSVGGVIFEVYNSNKMNRITLENKYYEKIFDDILLYNIPKAREYLCYVGGKLIGTKELQKAIISLRKNALFFKYNNLEFYNQLREISFDIEDYLINNEGEIARDEYVKFEKELDTKLEDLYTIISTYSVK